MNYWKALLAVIPVIIPQVLICELLEGIIGGNPVITPGVLPSGRHYWR